MNTIHHVPVLAATACLALTPTLAPAEEFDPAKMDEVMKKYVNPGKQNKAFKSWVGVWKAESTYWMQPGAPPMKSSGEAKFRMAMKGRYLVENFKTESPEMGVFMGQGTFAYDRVAKEYIHTWIDTMGTGVMISRGSASEDGNTLTLHATYQNPMIMQDVKYRLVSHSGDPKKRKLEMFATYPGKEEFKTMEINYTKQDDAKVGAAAGALSGAVIGNNVGEGDAKVGAVIGAGVGLTKDDLKKEAEEQKKKDK